MNISEAAMHVLLERRRQMHEEGWTAEHDDHHDDGAMAQAAACYALQSTHPRAGQWLSMIINRLWPWKARWWKPKDARQNLVVAAALLIAEIERRDRAVMRHRVKEHA